MLTTDGHLPLAHVRMTFDCTRTDFLILVQSKVIHVHQGKIGSCAHVLGGEPGNKANWWPLQDSGDPLQ